MKHETEDGFTVVEVLVVIIIIGIIAAIAIAAFLSQRKKANDAAVKSDLATVAQEYAAWTVDHDSKDRENLYSRASLFVFGDDVSDAERGDKEEWNRLVPSSAVNVSSNTTIEIVSIYKDNYTSTWPKKHDEGEFCLVANADHSTWDYDRAEGTMGPAYYDHLLFYDVKAGGVRTIEELSELGSDNVSCYGHLNRYLSTAS